MVGVRVWDKGYFLLMGVLINRGQLIRCPSSTVNYHLMRHYHAKDCTVILHFAPPYKTKCVVYNHYNTSNTHCDSVNYLWSYVQWQVKQTDII